MKVWTVVADYGLNGAGVLAVYDREPTAAECNALARQHVQGGNYPHTSVTGYGGWDIESHEVRS